MTVKFDQYWAIMQQKNKDYKKFIINDFIPTINRLGIHTVAGWSVLVGGYTEIIFEGVSNDLELVEKALKTPKYKELNEELQNYVKDYKTKVLVQTGRKDTYSKDIKENTIKFNKMWNIISGKKSDYHRFVIEEYYPGMESLGIMVAAEWEALIGEGPHIICEGRVQDFNNLLGNLQSEKFRKMKIKLRRYVEDYQSRFLSFHIQKIKGYKAASYEMV